MTPRTIYDYDVATGELTLLKRQPVLGGYDPAAYEQRPGVGHRARRRRRVPISLVYRRGTEPDGTAPGLLYGYGAYEISYDPYFSVARLSLLDRGFVYAIAHVRGGGEMGRRWYDDGKLHAQGQHVHRLHRLRRPPRRDRLGRTRTGLSAEGGSAGGLLIGAVVNLAPDRFRAVARRGAVRRRADHDPRPVAAADRDRVGGVGQPAGRPRGLPLHALLHAVREHRGARLPGDPRDDQPQRHPGATTSSRPSGSRGCARR